MNNVKKHPYVKEHIIMVNGKKYIDNSISLSSTSSISQTFNKISHGTSVRSITLIQFNKLQILRIAGSGAKISQCLH
jgi:hypothetical protein